MASSASKLAMLLKGLSESVLSLPFELAPQEAADTGEQSSGAFCEALPL